MPRLAIPGRARHGDRSGMIAADAYNLDRFVAAQDADGSYERAVAELRAGRKTSHWMWFVFPQIAGLGQSQASRQFAIRSLTEARAYLRHRVLGGRLIECAGILGGLSGRSAADIFGPVDAMKLRSSMTLFMLADPAVPVFDAVLGQYFGGRPDPLTQRIAAAAQPIPECGQSLWHGQFSEGRPADRELIT